MNGYSDRIEHALAFAAKHHERQVHKGARPPSGTGAANVAIILARYGRDDATIVAGILRDVVHDSLRERDRSMFQDRIRDKFGADIVDIAAATVGRGADDDGMELTLDEGRDDLLGRLDRAPEGAHWVLAADVLHEVSTVLADLRRTIDSQSVWSRLPMGREATLRWYRRVHERLGEVGFAAPIMRELGDAIGEVERLAAAEI